MTLIAAVITPANIWLAIRTAFTPLELVAVVFTLANVWLAIKEKIWTWPAGIVSVLLYLIVFWRSHLYLNAWLQVVYFVMSPDYNLYMDHQQAINLALFSEFAARQIQFAVPTQTLLLVRAKADGNAAQPS